MINVACFHGQHLSCLEVFKIPLALLAFAITLKGFNTLIGQSKDKRKSRYDLTSSERKHITYIKVGSHDPILFQLSFQIFLCMMKNVGVHTIQFSHPIIS